MSEERTIKFEGSENLPDLVFELPEPPKVQKSTPLKEIILGTLFGAGVGSVFGLGRIAYSYPYQSAPKTLILRGGLVLGTAAFLYQSTYFLCQRLFANPHTLWCSTIAGGVGGAFFGILARRPRLVVGLGISTGLLSTLLDYLGYFISPEMKQEQLKRTRLTPEGVKYREQLIRDSLKIHEEQRRREAEAFTKV
jgi:hypothetical protein